MFLEHVNIGPLHTENSSKGTMGMLEKQSPDMLWRQAEAHSMPAATEDAKLQAHACWH